MKDYVEGWLLFIPAWNYCTPVGETNNLINIYLACTRVYYTLSCTARLSRIPCFSKKHMLLFPKHKQIFNTWTVFTPLLPNSSNPFSSRDVLAPPSFGRAQTCLNSVSFPSAICFRFAVMPNFVLPGWSGWDQVDFRTALQGWRKPQFLSPEPWEQHSQPSGSFTWFQSPDSKIRTAWSPWFQILVWHQLW